MRFYHSVNAILKNYIVIIFVKVGDTDLYKK